MISSTSLGTSCLNNGRTIRPLKSHDILVVEISNIVLSSKLFSLFPWVSSSPIGPILGRRRLALESWGSSAPSPGHSSERPWLRFHTSSYYLNFPHCFFGLARDKLGPFQGAEGWRWRAECERSWSRAGPKMARLAHRETVAEASYVVLLSKTFSLVSSRPIGPIPGSRRVALES